MVRQSDAHAWAEVWIDGDWRRYDPTAAVSPARIEGSLDFAIPDAGRSPVPLHSEGPTDYASAAVSARPDLGSDIRSITKLYLRLRYEIAGEANDRQLLDELRKRIRAFRP